MYNFNNRQYIFRQSNGDTWYFFCDSRQNLCYRTLNRQNSWSNAVVLRKDVYQYFYADIDQNDQFHILFQDTGGNIYYSLLDNSSIRTLPLLASKNPSTYNKQFSIAFAENDTYFFYVLHHENSFMLACQSLSGNRVSNPKVIDYVSGSSIPCSVVYDRAQNIYVFYQSFDGKYLQLGYKKLGSQQKAWSDFTPVTKFAGNCEYPHAITDRNSVIHLCYQRRAPKAFELVYQQKSPDKNLWTPEIVIHSSVYSFENASIIQASDGLIIYWVRDDIIYYSVGTQNGAVWSKPARLSSFAGQQFQCICWKSNSPKDMIRDDDREIKKENRSVLPPNFYPGSVSAGLKLAFSNTHNAARYIADEAAPVGSPSREKAAAGNDIKSLVLDTFRHLQGSIDEVIEDISAIKRDIARLENAYADLAKDTGKNSIKLGVLERELVRVRKLDSRLDELNDRISVLKNDSGNSNNSGKSEGKDTPESTLGSNAAADNDAHGQSEKPDETHLDTDAVKPSAVSSLSAEELKVWEAWKEPAEWQDGSL